MAKEEAIELEGTVTEVLPDAIHARGPRTLVLRKPDAQHAAIARERGRLG